jgi:hypothetical protein
MASMSTTPVVCRVSGSSRHLVFGLRGEGLVLRGRVLVRWLCAGVGCPVGLAFPLGGRRVVVFLSVPYSPRSNAWLGPQPLCG